MNEIQSNFKILPVGKRILVEPKSISAPKARFKVAGNGGLTIRTGTIIDAGKPSEFLTSIGSDIIYNPGAGKRVLLESKEHLIMSDSEVLAILATNK